MDPRFTHDRPPAESEFFVACLCAEWCDSCRGFRELFLALGRRFPGLEFRWVDIEDEADCLGALEVEDFPTILVQRGPDVLFLGTMLPVPAILGRVLEEFCAQRAEQSATYAQASAERRAWQAHAGLRASLRR